MIVRLGQGDAVAIAAARTDPFTPTAMGAVAGICYTVLICMRQLRIGTMLLISALGAGQVALAGLGASGCLRHGFHHGMVIICG